MKKQYISPVVEVITISREAICAQSNVPVYPGYEPMG